MKAYSLCFLVIHTSLQSLTLVSGNNTKRIHNCSLIFHFENTTNDQTNLLAGFRLHHIANIFSYKLV